MLIGIVAVLLGFGLAKLYMWRKWKKIERNQRKV